VRPERVGRRAFAALVPFCVFVAVGCSLGGGEETNREAGTSPSASSSGTSVGLSDIDPCALVTRLDAQAVVGSGPAPRRARRIQDTFCSYSMERGYLGVLVATKRFSKLEFDVGARAAGGAPVAGLADAAYWRTRQKSLYVLKGSIVTRFDVFTNEAEPVLRLAAEALAKKAVARIPAGQAGPVLAVTPDERDASVNVCDLVSAQAVRELVGAPMSPERFTEVGYVGCHWNGPEGFVQASVLTKDYSAEEFEAGANGGRAVDGLGDQAFARVTDGLADVAVRKDSAVFTLRLAIPGLSEPTLREASRTLARKAVPSI
jgi:hypothetical protein